MSERQRQILAYIHSAYDATGRYPTRRAIARALGIGAHSLVQDDLRKLEKAGHVHLSSGIDRGIVLINEPTPGQLKARIAELEAALWMEQSA